MWEGRGKLPGTEASFKASRLSKLSRGVVIQCIIHFWNKVQRISSTNYGPFNKRAISTTSLPSTTGQKEEVGKKICMTNVTGLLLEGFVVIIHLTLRCSVLFEKDRFKGRWSLTGQKIFLNIVVTKGFAVFFLLLFYCSLISQASQAHGTSVLCKLTFSQESQCRVTSNRWDFVWEIKYWGLRTLNFIIYTFFSIK